jgi:hypothetical protein
MIPIFLDPASPMDRSLDILRLHVSLGTTNCILNDRPMSYGHLADINFSLECFVIPVLVSITFL